MFLAALAAPVHGQSPGADVRGEVFVGSEVEDYLRLLQLTGHAPLYPWSIRSFSPAEVDRLLPTDSAHPWAGRYDLRPDSSGGPQFSWVRPQGRMVYNSAFPYGLNDGAVWAGRGVTASLQTGFAARYGPVSLTVAPLVFWAENREFELQKNGQKGQLVYAAGGFFPESIDLPQRFGADPVTRIDPGQSTLRVDLAGVAAGISTANQHWGPARVSPILLGSQGPGFAHAFAGTARPIDLWIGRAHGRLVWGRLEESAYSPVAADAAGRVMAGIVGTFTPRGAPGIELGVARFYHYPSPSGALPPGYLLRPLETFVKAGTKDPYDEDAVEENQLASVFFRAVFPGSQVEMYGEYSRDDHNFDLRDFLLEPDNSRAFLVGLSKAWPRSPTNVFVLSGELAHAQIPSLARIRNQSFFYTHHSVRQGHTNRGQLLGSPMIAFSGGGATVGADYYTPLGRWSLGWQRMIRQNTLNTIIDDPSRPQDAYHIVRGEAVRFIGRWELLAEAMGVYNRHRYMQDDAFNLGATLGVSTSW